MAKHELARYLRDRRASLHPVDVGLPPHGRRRTPGLRREEVAGLAYLSVDYYARLEQARGHSPSVRVLASLAEALRLGPAERAHLFRLAGASQSPPVSPVRRVRPHVAELLRRLPETGAVVTDASYDVIAWNPLAEALLGGLATEPNLARRRFLAMGHAAHGRSAEEFAGIAVSRLREAADRYPQDPRLAQLLTELRETSEEFTEVWDTNPVQAPGHRSKTVDHPTVGPLRINCDVLAVPEDDQQIVFITADLGSPAARAFRHLVRERATAPGADRAARR